MKITILAEGETEKAFAQFLRNFLSQYLAGCMPKIVMFPYDGQIPTHDKLRRVVDNLLNDAKQPSDAVIALTDVYTGKKIFENATDAKRKLCEWVGKNESFFPHVAQHDFEAWLLPYWSRIQTLAGTNRHQPGTNPELVNHMKPPSYHLKEVFRTGSKKKAYIKTRDGYAILRGQDLHIAIQACAELKSFVNTILKLCDASQLV